MAKMAKDQLISWLNDAYAMEKAQHKILENHIGDAKEFETLRSRMEEHVQETEGQCDRIQQCIESLGGKLSGAKVASGTFMGTLQGMAIGMGHDKIVKNTMADYAAEHFEIAMYETIKVAAEELGHPDIVSMCEDTIREEQDMADFLREQLPDAVTTVVQNAAGIEATSETGTADTATRHTEPAFGERIEGEEEDDF